MLVLIRLGDIVLGLSGVAEHSQLEKHKSNESKNPENLGKCSGNQVSERTDSQN